MFSFGASSSNNKNDDGSRGDIQVSLIEGGEPTSERTRTVSSSPEENVFHKATWFSCYINLTNTIVGSGMLGLPYAFSNTGWIFGTALMCVCATLSATALHLLSVCAFRVGGPNVSFYSVAKHATPRASFLIDVAVAVKCFGVATSYLIVISGLMPEVMEQFGADDAYKSHHIWVTIGFIIVIPLSFLPSLDALRFTSVLSVAFVVFLVFLIIFFALHIPGLNPCHEDDDDHQCVGDKSLAVMNLDTFKVLSIFVFGFTCHQNIFSVVNEIRRPTQHRVNLVIVAAIGSALFLYMLVAMFGYSTYGENVESNILLNYPRTPLTSTARVFVSLLVAFSYPLQSHPSRKSLMSLINHYIDNDAEISDNVYNFRYMLITCAFLIGSYFIAMTIEDLGVVLALVGATGSTIVSYILPGSFYYFTFEKEGPVWKRYIALALLCIGVVFMPVCLTFIFL